MIVPVQMEDQEDTTVEIDVHDYTVRQDFVVIMYSKWKRTYALQSN